MNDVSEFFSGLFDTDKWPARWQCGEWSDFLGWLYIASELMIWTAYFLIPLLIINYFSNKRNIIRFQRVYILFASFILLCGSTHFIDAMMFWIPMYRLNALVRFATAVISLFTVYHLFKILPEVFKQKTNMELENEIKRRIEVEGKLAEANQSLEAFAYIASHDLQEPLRKIQTFSSLLHNQNVSQFDDKSRSYTEKLIASSARMQNMIKDVLTLSTIKSEVELHRASLNNALDVALEDLEIKIKDTNTVIHKQNLPDVIGNEEYLSQMFMNFISNAIKFSKVAPVIELYAEIDNDQVHVYIKDNGIGMDEPDFSRIFNPFQRLNAKNEFEGTGVGLSICKKIVDLHNGTIKVQSVRGVGTTFIVTLPRG